MRRLPRFCLWATFMLAGLLGTAGCHKNQPAAGSETANNAQDQGPDPAAVNLAPATYNPGASPAGQSYSTQSPQPEGGAANANDQGDSSDYNEQPTETATEPPPPLPDYQQPPPPGDGYIWTPGYWAWGGNGYYWVPGAWVEPPYENALWTPGYWGFYGSRYQFYPGHWGPYIGFYGGINYGFGYVGTGYEGGYWNSGHFFYNREYNNVSVNVVHNVYSYNAATRMSNASRVSFHGGTGGIQARPGPSEKAAWHEPVAPRMNTQVQHAQSFRSERGQYASANHGNPQTAAISRPVPADRNVRPAVPSPARAGSSAGRPQRGASGGRSERPEGHR